ncbi:LOW QUALITY PROTEIN: putative disease resistance RPP13-like protein 1 [Populus alba]|uniref:LOW QUALITY PROTEIN: putative disease resistance RPP13-like protein 1 n=1 Tax=Populus alba TaxID=43335 RepID=UPI003CC771EC
MFMASSSSSSRPGGGYDVFLSFRGEDTRKKFTDHLFTALQTAGIHTFRDNDKLRIGEEISSQLLQGIQESKISIVVFSKGYASSTWCLDELEKILDCKQTTGQFVIPVFYDIAPSDIRKQTGSFAEAFDKHEERFKEEMEKVQKWRKALEKAANIAGLDPHSIANGHESKLIQTIVEEVLSKLKTTMISGGELLDDAEEKQITNTAVRRLKTTIISGGGLLDDAEEKQITNTAVREWLAEYKDAVYDAEDFLDEIDYEAQTFIGQTPKRLIKLGDLQERLDYLVKRKVDLGLINRTGKEPSSPKRPTTSLVDERGVYGRDYDTAAILKLLLSDDANEENPGVVPIGGMGGVGKTTLAQLVYNHNRVEEWFGLKAWVCVSEDFSVSKLTKVILEAFGSKPACDNLDQLQRQLKQRWEGNKFLVVLDDVWNEDYAEWDRFLTPLKYGAQGSKILVTTRNESVARVVRTVPTHHLKELTEDSCWSVFAKHAFRGENPNDDEELLEIGRKIARKCKGLPLAAKTLGGLLRTQRDVEEWEKLLESNLWDLRKDNILPALRLSYLYLLPHLKKCFAYCALFPKDYEFQKDELVLFWMAEGFLDSSAVDDEMEKAGAMCFDDLLSRSFFQQSSASPSSFVMHDLMHDLAIHVSGQFCFRLGENNSSKATRSTRHLSHTGAHFCSTELENIREAQLIRTFQTFVSYWHHFPDWYNEIFHILPTLGRLRVLSLSDHPGAAKMLCSTSNLKHLRYLDLSPSDSPSNLVTLPEGVSALLNLQTLILKKCRQLASLPDLGNLKHLRHLNLEGAGIERLPASLVRLINLRYLNISQTNSLKEMPPHIGQLAKLQTLTLFLVGRQSENSIKELGKLRHLRGVLRIKNLENVVDARDAAEANLKGKKLDHLSFSWNGKTHDPQHVTSTLEKLEPNRKVKDLQIYCYGGVRFPEWVGDSSFSNIVSLMLYECTNCTSLPPLGQLASLEDLSIYEFHKVETVGSEFYGNRTAVKKPFESLKKLRFVRMAVWREWISDEGSREAFPLLDELTIVECPNLAKVLPSHHLPCVTRLKIRACERLAAPFPRFHRLHSLDVSGNRFQMGCSPSEQMGWAALKCFALDLVPNVNSLSISDCPDLESLCAHERPLNDLTSLHSLSIWGCPKLVSFPRGGLPAPVLTRLVLNYCNNLKQLPESMHSLLPSLNHLEINDCREVELCPEGGFPSTLQSLEICRCNKLIAGRMQWGLQTLPSLSHFTIGGHENIESFPEEMLLPSSLTSLKIEFLKHLKSLDYKWLQHLTSLRELAISHCPMIESMPEEGLPSSLSSLEISGCPMLRKSCEREKGKDWPKISHIPCRILWSW